MRAVTDEQLIQGVADGDPSCLATLFERHHSAVYRYFMQILRDRALCEDLVQDVFLKMLRKAKTFRHDGSFRGWMFNIARHTALDHLRRDSRTGTAVSADVDDLADHRTAEQAAAGTQGVAMVQRALATLPAAVQEVIWLGRFEFDNYEDLGQALDCSAGAARVRMHRAMKLLNLACTELHGDAVNG